MLCGPERRCLVFKYLLNQTIKPEKDIIIISDSEEIDMLSIKGSIYLARKANLL